MNIIINTEKLWDFVRDAYEEGKEDGYSETLKVPRPWQTSEAKKQVTTYLADTQTAFPHAEALMLHTDFVMVPRAELVKILREYESDFDIDAEQFRPAWARRLLEPEIDWVKAREELSD